MKRASIPGFGHTRSSTPHASFSTAHCPLVLSILLRFALPAVSHGLQLKASPASKMHPDPPPILSPLSRWKPSVKHASMEVVGGGVSPRTLREPKSVWVSSFDAGPRSDDFPGADCRAIALEESWARRAGLSNRPRTPGLTALRTFKAPRWIGHEDTECSAALSAHIN